MINNLQGTIQVVDRIAQYCHNPAQWNELRHLATSVLKPDQQG